MSNNTNIDPNVILFHTDALMDKKQKDYIEGNNSIKICVGKKKDFKDNFDENLELPATIKEINAIVENTSAKKTSQNQRKMAKTSKKTKEKAARKAASQRPSSAKRTKPK